MSNKLQVFITYAFSFFLLSGIIKGLMGPISLPVDLTFLSALFCFTVVLGRLFFAKNLTISKNDLLLILTFLLFYTWILFSLTYSLSTNYGLKKAAISTLNILALLFPIFYNVNWKAFVRFLTCVSLIGGTLILIYKSIFTYEQLNVFGLDSNYLGVGLLLGFTLVLRLEHKTPFMNGLLFLLLILSGARGPLIFYLLCLLIYWIINFKISMKISTWKQRSVYRVFLMLMLVFLFLFYYSESLYHFVSSSVNRFGLFFSDSSGESVASRMKFIVVAWDMFTEAPLIGYGFGSFGIYYSGLDGNIYPHNLVLEILSELGLIGLFIFLLFCVFLLKSSTLALRALFYLVCLYAFLNVLKSNNFSELRLYFGVVFIVLSLKASPYTILNIRIKYNY